MALVIHAMHKLGRHEELLAIRKAGNTRLIGRIVMRVDHTKIGPGVHKWTTLRIEFAKVVIQLGIPTALVTVAPNDYRRTVTIAAHKGLDQRLARLGRIAVLPTAKFVEHQQT